MRDRRSRHTRGLVALVALVILAVPPALADTASSPDAQTPDEPTPATGVYVDVIADGGINKHTYDNGDAGRLCIDLVTTYTVFLNHLPDGSVLGLSVAEVKASDTSAYGYAAVRFEAGYCTRFTIQVEGAHVPPGVAIPYAATVHRAQPGLPDWPVPVIPDTVAHCTADWPSSHCEPDPGLFGCNDIGPAQACIDPAPGPLLWCDHGSPPQCQLAPDGHPYCVATDAASACVPGTAIEEAYQTVRPWYCFILMGGSGDDGHCATYEGPTDPLACLPWNDRAACERPPVPVEKPCKRPWPPTECETIPDPSGCHDAGPARACIDPIPEPVAQCQTSLPPRCDVGVGDDAYCIQQRAATLCAHGVPVDPLYQAIQPWYCFLLMGGSGDDGHCATYEGPADPLACLPWNEGAACERPPLLPPAPPGS